MTNFAVPSVENCNASTDRSGSYHVATRAPGEDHDMIAN
jgi:hypothetical protein